MVGGFMKTVKLTYVNVEQSTKKKIESIANSMFTSSNKIIQVLIESALENPHILPEVLRTQTEKINKEFQRKG